MREQQQESVDSELAKESEVKEGMHKGCALSSFIFAVVADVVTELTRGCAE